MKATTAVATFLLSLTVSAQQSTTAPMSVPPPYPTPQGERVDLQTQLGGLDQQFMTEAAQSGLTEVEMGKLARTNGQSDAVRQFGERLVEDHQRANRELGVVAGRLSFTLPQVPDAALQHHLTQMGSLRGIEFDNAFSRHLVSAHSAALNLFRRQATNGQSRDLREFAAKTIPMLEQHLRIATDIRDGKVLSSL